MLRGGRKSAKLTWPEHEISPGYEPFAAPGFHLVRSWIGIIAADTWGALAEGGGRLGFSLDIMASKMSQSIPGRSVASSRKTCGQFF